MNHEQAGASRDNPVSTPFSLFTASNQQFDAYGSALTAEIATLGFDNSNSLGK